MTPRDLHIHKASGETHRWWVGVDYLPWSPSVDYLCIYICYRIVPSIKYQWPTALVIGGHICSQSMCHVWIISGSLSRPLSPSNYWPSGQWSNNSNVLRGKRKIHIRTVDSSFRWDSSSNVLLSNSADNKSIAGSNFICNISPTFHSVNSWDTISAALPGKTSSINFHFIWFSTLGNIWTPHSTFILDYILITIL